MSYRYPFTAVVGADDLALALILNAISPAIGGVLVRGEKGTAKSTIVRALPDVLPRLEVVDGCRFSCDPLQPATDCPDGPHPTDAPRVTRETRLVELPVGASEDRVTGSLDLAAALSAGKASFQPGLLAQAHRGLLYVDEVNLLGDHLVDVLLDAAAMGRNTVEREGMSISHPAKFVLIGTMNPEEGELRPQLLDRFGLSVDVSASRDPQQRAEVVRRRLAFDDDPHAFVTAHAGAQSELRERIASAREALGTVDLTDWALRTIARVCAGFDVDGMRADIVLARTATAHAAWRAAARITRQDIRAAALLVLSHRQRKGPFDPPGLDEEKLDRLLDEEPEPTDPEDGPENGPENGPDGEPDGDSDGNAGDHPAKDDPAGGAEADGNRDQADDDSNGDSTTRPPADTPSADTPGADNADGTTTADTTAPADDAPGERDRDEHRQDGPASGLAACGIAAAGQTFRTRRFEVRGVGRGESGRRSQAFTTPRGRIVGVDTRGEGPLHVGATVRSAARDNVRDGERLVVNEGHLTHARLRGRESNLVMFCVDASGSMAARKRMSEVKAAILSLLQDAYERRDKVALVCFRQHGAQLVLPATSSVDLAAARLSRLEHGGRTPLAEGLELTAATLMREARKDARRRPLVVIVTDGRATSGTNALARAQQFADAWPATGYETVVVDCESGRFRMGLAADLARRMHATHVPLENVSAAGLLGAIDTARTTTQTDPSSPSAHANSSSRPNGPTRPAGPSARKVA